MLAALGVRVFFVLSGFLITLLLLGEQAKTGTLSLRHFYLRRTLRIFPAFYAYVAVVALAAAVGFVQLGRFDLLAAVTYTINYHHDRAWYLGHAWSLAVEEQFYLLWPFLLKSFGSARASQIAIGTLLVCPLLRMSLLVAAPSLRPGIGETFPTVADAIATGCLLAVYRSRVDSSPRLLGFLRGRAFWLTPIIALLAALVRFAKFDHLVGQTMSNVGIALLIERVVRFPEAWPGRLLNAGPVVFFGVLSYSLYLWQQPFLNRDSTLAICRFPMNLALTIGAAMASYYLVEQPALRVRAWLRATHSTAMRISTGSPRGA